MKNKVVTLLCILTILITTGIVAFADYSNTLPDRVSADETPVADDLIEQIVSGDIDKELLPGATLNGKVTVNAINADYPAFVRIVVAFEADRFDSYNSFTESIVPTLSESYGWTIHNNWIRIEYENEYYYMTYAVYNEELFNGNAVILKYTVNMNSKVSNELVNRMDDGQGYDVLVVTQATQSDGWTNSNGEITAEDVLDAAFGELSSINHPWVNSIASNDN